MFELRLFGGLALTGPDGLITGRASQRRRLAVLAILAQARGRPVSRDRLLALLWSEAEPASGRHLLTDSLYVLRDALGDDVVRSIGDDVSLNPDRVANDVEGFHRDLERSDPAAAVARYAQGGPFLDGVHISDAPEFERWTDSVRSRLAEQYRQALEALAKEAGTRGDREAAVARWRQLVASDPCSSRYAVACMRALADAGDVPAALELARTHEHVVRAELDAPPDPAVIALIHQLRACGAAPMAATPAVTGGEIAAAAEPPSPVPGSPAAATRAGPRRALVGYGLAGLLVVILLAAAGVRWRGGRLPINGTTPVPSIVVLPLQNLSADPADAGLADALTEELIAMLATLGRVRVIASTSAFAFRGQSIDVRRVADSLRVRYVVEGGVEKRGSRLRVHLRLVDGQDGSARWSHRYDEELRDVFRVQDDIARSVARELDLRLVGPAGSERLRHRTGSVVAYELYLRGRDPALVRTDSGKWAGVEYFRRAIAADSTFAAAWAGLAFMYQLLGEMGHAEMRQRAEAAALRAVGLDDSLAEAHRELGYVRMIGARDLRSAEAELKRAIALDPGAAASHGDLSIVYLWLGRPAEALAEARLAEGADPLSAFAIVAIARALYVNGQPDEALTHLRSVAALQPPVRLYYQLAGLCYIEQRMWPEAIATLRRGAELGTGDAAAWLGYALARSGDREGATRILRDLHARWQRRNRGAYELAVLYAGLGDRDQAFEWLGRAVDRRQVIWQIMGPAFEDLRGDPRFGPLRRRLGLPPARD